MQTVLVIAALFAWLSGTSVDPTRLDGLSGHKWYELSAGDVRPF
jgi:hypothetical protein